jgi:hypothetical protein
MKRLIVLLFILLATTVYAGTTTTNGYFYTHAVGDSGATAATTIQDVREATDAVIKLNVNHRTNGTETHTNLSNSGHITIGGSTGVRASGATGVATLGGVGNSNNSNIAFDFESVDNEVDISDGGNGTKALTITGMGLRPAKVTGDPCGTAANDYPEGSIFWNDTSNYHCYCNASNADIKMNDLSTACF